MGNPPQRTISYILVLCGCSRHGCACCSRHALKHKLGSGPKDAPWRRRWPCRISCSRIADAPSHPPCCCNCRLRCLCHLCPEQPTAAAASLSGAAANPSQRRSDNVALTASHVRSGSDPGEPQGSGWPGRLWPQTTRVWNRTEFGDQRRGSLFALGGVGGFALRYW